MEKKITKLKGMVLLIILMISNISFSQVDFTSQYDVSLKGDMLQIGNNILNRRTNSATANTPFNDENGNNNSYSMQYIDIDGDASTFNSTTANLTIPTSILGCYRVNYAALYWAGVYNPSNIGAEVNVARLNQVKFKLPGGNYIDITGTTIHDSRTVGQPVSSSNFGYAAYANVTSLVQGLVSAEGTYGVANIQSGLGGNTSGGWTLFVIYEDPLTTAKNITLFHGFQNIKSNDPRLNIPISGFNAIPIGPVRAKLAFAALEGDRDFTRDRLLINGIPTTVATRPANNFFNATINTTIAGVSVPFTARNINSSNLLGFDAGIISVANLSNSIIANSAQSATISLETNNDSYVYYLNAFGIEIIQPQINLIKTVSDLGGTDVGNQMVNLGQELYYDLTFQNIGNDDAINFTITDVLPVNVTPLSIDVSGAPGVPNPGVGSSPLVFTIPNALVTEFGAQYTIRIRVRVAENCYDLRDACSNEITNQAYKTYSSFTSGNLVENQQPSASGIDACNFPDPGATNFIADINDCTFESTEVLCGEDITLTAGSGYVSYQWHNGAPPTAANAISGATGPSFTTSTLGTYTVVNTAPAPCLTIVETFNVIDFDSALTNPVLPYADQVDVCPNDGTELPKIFLCGVNDSQLIETNILNATIEWEYLNEGSCTPVANTSCPNRGATCGWVNIANGPNFNVLDAHQYRIIITYQNGCTKTFYFNVYKSSFTPTVTTTDIICNTPGTITVNGVPSGYEFNINNGPWQSPSNVFSITTPGIYTVNTQQIGGGVGNCVYTIPNVPIRQRDFTVDVTVDDALCYGDTGEIRVQVNNVEPQYTFELFLGATLFNIQGPVDFNDYTFTNLPPGTYTLNVSTSDGCFYTQTITISDPPLLTLTGAVTQPITCGDGEITLYPVGGTGPYTYSIDGTPGFEAVPVFVITTPGTYCFTVTDYNNCTARTCVDITAIPPPVFTVTQTDILCYGDTTGEIVFNVTNTNGYEIEYSITPVSGTWGINPVFSNLVAGTYEAQIRYTLDNGATYCNVTPQIITIAEPASAVTASAGVSELAGCGPAGEGKVRITNAQGGTAPYQYSFDGGVTWGSLNEAYLPPGTHTVCIRDANLCTNCYTVILDPPPTDPTITVAAPDYNCDGTATTTVTVNNNGGNFTYTYQLDNGTPQNSNVFTDVPCGSHTVTANYINTTIPTFSNLLFEDFGIGAPTTSPGINPAYCFENQSGVHPPGYTCNLDDFINDGEYGVTPRINPRFGSWLDPRDHTSGGTNPNGRFLCVNIGGSAGIGGILYSKPIFDVIPNQDIEVSLWAMNLIRTTADASLVAPEITIQLVSDLGMPSEVIIATSPAITVPRTDQWDNYTLALNPGTNGNISFVVRSYNTLFNGNDIVIDDINVYQLPIACSTSIDFPILIDCNQAFTAQITGSSDVSCNGANDGQITIAAQNFDLPYGFDYNYNGTWINSQFSPVTIPNLAGGTYNVLIRYDDTAGTCSFPFTQVIGEPNALVASAVLSNPATCITGGTITASATGGTGNYLYEIHLVGNPPGSFGSNNVFANLVPGDYIVTVIDALSCTDPIDVPITIGVPTPPTAVIDVTSDLCYDGVNQATIVVTASGGVGAYTYSLNNGTPQGNNIFTGLTPGTYNIVVTDSYGCTVALPAVTIAPELLATTIVTKGLDCSASPDAAITLTATGGTAPYTYEVFFNTASLGTFPLVPNPFVYTTSNPGTYEFTITDATGCTVDTAPVTVTPLPVLNVPVLTLSPTAIIRCNGDATAAFSVTASGGLPPYTYSIGTGFQGNNTFQGLPAGLYTVTLMDANECTTTAQISIAEPAPIAFLPTKLDLQCGASGTVPGSITVTAVSGGTGGPYTYILRKLPTVAGFPMTYTTVLAEDYTFSGLNFGDYTVTVVDGNGCQLTQNISVASPPDSLTIDANVTADCTNGGTVTVTVNPIVTGAGGPYYFSIYNGDPYPLITFTGTTPNPPYQEATTPGGLSSIFTNLFPDVTYCFIVYDASTNCYYFQCADTPIPTSSTIVPVLDANNVTCTGAADGNVTFTITGYSGTSVDYHVYNSDNSELSPPIFGNIATSTGPITGPTISPLIAGEYYILFTEVGGVNAGCGKVGYFEILESPVLLSLTASVTHNDNECSQAGQITVVGSNGTPPYMYQITDPGVPPTWPGGQPSGVFNGLAGGNYDVHVQDAYGCVQSILNIFVPTDTLPSLIMTLVPSTLCNATEGNYSVLIDTDTSVGVPPFTYSFNNGSYQPFPDPHTINGLNSGTYPVTIRDANGCTYSQSITINPPLIATLTPTIAATQDCGLTDGIITVNASGGSGMYSYSIIPNAGVIQNVNVFSNLQAGVSYTVTITDTNTTCPITRSITLPTPSNPTFSTTVFDATCNGSTNGSIVVNLTGTNTDPIYNYAITAGPVTRPSQPSNVFNNLPAGTYTVTVTSGRGCPATASVTVGEPAPIVVPAPTVTQFACNATNAVVNASIVIDPALIAGGSGNYINYIFSNTLTGVPIQSGTSNTLTVANEAGGNYTLTVYDDNGCFGVYTPIIVDPFIRIAFDDPAIDVVTAITCPNPETITINLVASINGVATALPTDIIYTVTGNSGNPYSATQINNPTFTGLTIGSYTITATNDNTGCSVSMIYFVFNPNTFVVNATVTSNVICSGSNTGSVEFTFIDQNVNPFDEAGPFDYFLYDASGGLVTSGTTTSAGPIAIGSLFAGAYQLQTVLLNDPRCPAVTNFTISQPAAPLTISATSTPISCLPGGDGTISAVGLQGWGGPYQYELSEATLGVIYPLSSSPVGPGLNPGQYVNLLPGTYLVSVRDNVGCPASATFVLDAPPAIDATLSGNITLPCIGNTTGTITVLTTTGGFGSGYLYVLNNSVTGSTAPQTSNVFTNLGAGTYTVTISDPLGCRNTFGTVVIAEPSSQVSPLVTVIRRQGCTPATPAIIRLSASGGTPDYSYGTTQGGPYPNTLVAGGFVDITLPYVTATTTFTYYVVDANSCIERPISFPVTPLDPVNVVLDTTNATISCFYGTMDPQTPLNDLATVVATATGGVGNYTFTLNPSPTGVSQSISGNQVTFSNIPEGTYTVSVISGVATDCAFTSSSFTVVPPAEFQLLDPQVILQKCPEPDLLDPNALNYAIIAQGVGGTPPYQYSITPHVQTQNDGMFTNLIPNASYTIRIIDANGCFRESALLFVNEIVRMVPEPYRVFDEICSGDGGYAFFQMNGGTASGGINTLTEGYTFYDPNGTLIANSVTGYFDETNAPILGNLPAGDNEGYYILDDNDCRFDIKFEVLPGIDVNPQAISDILCVAGNNLEVNVNVDYNTDLDVAALTFVIDNDPLLTQSGSGVFTNTGLSSGTHEVTVTYVDPLDPTRICVATDTFEVDTLPDTLDLDLLEVGVLNHFTMTAIGGTAPYSFSVNGQYFGQGNSLEYQVYVTGLYTVTVVDGNGCIVTKSIPMTFIDVEIPNYFTPISGGWSPLYLDNYPNAVTYVFDRYSRKLITLRPGQTWDGTYNGSPLPSGDYWYTLKLNGETDTREFVGNLTLYR